MAQIIHDVDLPNTGDGDPLRTAFVNQNEMNTELYDTKVDKVTGQGLSENNFTDELKDKLDNIQEFAEVNIQSDWLQGDEDADDYIKNKPENFVSYPYKAIFPFVDGNVFTMPDGVAVSDVRPNGSGSDIGWTQVGVTLTFTSYTLVADDFLVVIGFFNPANVFSPTSGSIQTITSADLAIGVDDSDPENIVLSFGGVVTDGATINGSGTSSDPLVVIGGGGGGGTWGSITGTLSSQTDLQNALDLKANLTDLDDYLQHTGFDFQFNTVATGYPYGVGAFSAGTLTTQSDSISLQLNRPNDIIECWTINGNASNVNGGYRFGVASQNPMYVGSIMFMVIRPLRLTNLIGRFGLIQNEALNPNTALTGNNNICLEFEDDKLRFKCGTTVSQSASPQYTIPNTDWLYIMFEVESLTEVRCKIRNSLNGTLVYNEVLTTNLPISQTGVNWIGLRIANGATSKIASADGIFQVARQMTKAKKPHFLKDF